MVTTQNSMPTLEQVFANLIDQASDEIARNAQAEISVDCSELTMIKSYMLGRLIRLHLDARQRGASLVLENVNELVFKVVTLTRLDRMLQIRLDEPHDVPGPRQRGWSRSND